MTKRFLLLGLGVVVVLGISIAAVVVLFRSRGTPAPAPPASPDATPEQTPAPSLQPFFTPPPLADTCPAAWIGQPDEDGDGLPDNVESALGTNPAGKDTDGDGFSDGDEVQKGYNPTVAGAARLDRDNDGLLEDGECEWRTDPTNPDSDGDGFLDGAEVAKECDPTLPGDGKGSDCLKGPLIIPPEPIPLGSPPPVLPPPPAGGVKLPDVPKSQLKVMTSNTATDIRAYLAAVDSIRPPQLDGQILGSALLNAFQGQPAALSSVRNGFTAYEQQLLATPVPQSAIPHHILHIALIRYVHERLGVIQTTAKVLPNEASAAAREMEMELPRYVTKLQQLRSELNALAQGTS